MLTLCVCRGEREREEGRREGGREREGERERKGMEGGRKMNSNY